MKANYILLLIVALSANLFHINAQPLNMYNFTQEVATYDSLTTGDITLTPGTSPYLTQQYRVTLPFQFSLDTLSSDSLWIDLAGFCALKKTHLPNGNIGSNTGYPILRMPGYNGVFSVMSINNQVLSTNSAFKLRAATLGNAPNRIFVVEWRNFRTTGMHFQVRLHESDGKIEYKYNKVGTYVGTGQYEVGIRIGDTSIANGQTILRTNGYYGNSTQVQNYSWNNSVPATLLAEKVIWSGQQSYPMPGLTYTWTRPLHCSTVSIAGLLPDSFTVCAGTQLLLHPQNLANMQSIQWQVSTDGNAWENVTNGSGAQNVNYTTGYLKNINPVWYRMRGLCPASGQTIYSNVTKVTTQYQTAEYFEGFEGINPNMLPNCMRTHWNTNIYGNLAWRTVVGGGSVLPSYEGDRVVENYSSNKEWLFTPGVYLEAGKKYRFSQKYLMSNSASDSIYMGIGTAPTPDSIENIASHSIILTPGYTPDYSLVAIRDRYRIMDFAFTVPVNGIYFGGIKRANTGGSVYSDNIEIQEVPAIDVRLDTILHPTMVSTRCFDNQMQVTIKVSNVGLQPVSNIPVFLRLGNTILAQEVINQTIAPGTDFNYTFTQTVNMPGIYQLYRMKAWTALSTDTYHSNDSSYTIGIRTDTLKALPYLQNFENYNLPVTLSSYRWFGSNTVNSIISSGNASRILRIKFAEIPVGSKDSIASVPVGPIQANSFLRFRYRMANTNGDSAPMQATDTVYVLGSTDCGYNTDTLMRIHSGMQTNSSALVLTQPIPLAAFQGGRLRISFVTARNAPGSNFFFDIDSFHIVNLTPTDLELTSIYRIPALVCAGAAAPVSVVVKNLGALLSTGFNVKAYEQGQSTPLINYTYAGILNYQESDTFQVGTITPTGTSMHLHFVVTQIGDINSSNDSIEKIIQVVIPANPLVGIDTTFCDSTNLNLNLPGSELAFWYNSSQPADLLHIGNELNGTTAAQDYSVGIRQARVDTAGQMAYHPNWNNFGGYNGYGLLFHASADVFIDSIALYPFGNSTAVIDLLSCADCTQPDTLGTYNLQVSGANGSTKYWVVLNQFVPAGSGYFLRLRSFSNINGFRQDFPFSGFPVVKNTSPIHIESSFIPSQGKHYDRYYYFYDWRVRLLSDCMSDLSPVTVSITASPIADFNFTVNGSQVTFTNTSTGNGDFHWDFGNGATNNSFDGNASYDQNGDYSVTLTQNNDCGTSTKTKTVRINTTAIASLNNNWERLEVYPNPVTDQLFVVVEAQQTTGPATLQIMNALGNPMMNKPIKIVAGKNKFTLALKGVPAGNYWLLVKGENGFTTKPFVVK